MEKYSEYLMRMKRKQVKPKLKQSSSSMEDDDDKVLAWPPRSYTCSFCKREFRSAQALGGHMNVHRRDKAKLKQSNNSNIAAMEPPSSPPVSSATIYFQENYSGDHQKGCKRQRMISSSCSKTVSFMPVMHDPCLSSDKNSGMEEIDLELRVGVSPFVK